MSILLDALQFNSPSKGNLSHVINLRRDGKRPLTLPEWRRGVCHRPEDSPVAYQVGAAPKGPCYIMARFRQTDPAGTRSAKVRAVPDESTGRNILGPIQATTVSFNADNVSDWQRLELREHRLQGAGVGAWTVAWRWESCSDAAWAVFDRTEHRVFTILGPPNEPWKQHPFDATNICLPWVDALELACRWAHGSKTPDEAAVAITRQINDFGQALLEYECQLPGNPVYGFFGLTSFIDLLSGGAGRGKYVACTDCACAIVIFSNLLGCDLWKIDLNTEPLDGSDPPRAAVQDQSRPRDRPEGMGCSVRIDGLRLPFGRLQE